MVNPLIRSYRLSCLTAKCCCYYLGLGAHHPNITPVSSLASPAWHSHTHSHQNEHPNMQIRLSLSVKPFPDFPPCTNSKSLAQWTQLLWPLSPPVRPHYPFTISPYVHNIQNFVSYHMQGCFPPANMCTVISFVSLTTTGHLSFMQMPLPLWHHLCFLCSSFLPSSYLPHYNHRAWYGYLLHSFPHWSVRYWKIRYLTLFL